MRLASLVDLKKFLEKTDLEHDSLLELILDSVSSSFEGYTNRHFEKASRTEYFDSGGRVFRVSAIPIDSVIATVVIVDGTTQTNEDDYFVFHAKGYIEFSTDTYKVDPKEVEITYTGGYGWTAGTGDFTLTPGTGNRIDVPADLSFACIIQSSYIFRNRKNVGLMSISLPDGSINTNNQDEFLPQVLSVLDRYKL